MPGGYETVHVVAYWCNCARCGRLWMSVCGRPCARLASAGLQPVVGHAEGCRPPARCPRCGAGEWWRESKGRGLAGASTATRKRVAAAGRLAIEKKKGEVKA